ncbi:MAG: ComEC/Rec2 family competence protein [Actinobacteria bacterium]|nr:ComEC/Rec2 family competence protein [Actinomycetota bacterium]
MVLSGAFVIGTASGWMLHPSVTLAFAAGLIGLGFIVAAMFSARIVDPDPHAGHYRYIGLAGVLIVMGSFLVAVCDAGIRLDSSMANPIRSFDGRSIVVTGRLITEAQRKGDLLAFGFLVDHTAGAPMHSRVQVRAHRSSRALIAGERLRLRLKVAAYSMDNPVERSWVLHGYVAGGFASGEPQAMPGGDVLAMSASSFRSNVGAMFTGAIGPDRGPLLLGLVFGDTRQMQAKTLEDFRTSGLSHLVAVSGANLAMVLAALVILMRLTRVPRRVQMGACLAAVGCFTYVTGAEPSVLRASVMAIIGLTAVLAGRRSDAMHSLAIACIVLLAVDPSMLWSIGFQLSFIATAGILLISRPLADRLARLPKVLAEALAVSISAQAAVMPLLAFHFGQVSTYALPANTLAFPLVAPATVLGLLAATFGSIFRPISKPMVQIAGWFVSPLVAISHTFAHMPSSNLAVRSNSLSALVVGYLVFIAGCLWIMGRRRAARWPVAIAISTFALSAFIPVASATPPQGLRVTFFDIGQGDAALVQGPQGARILVDGGPEGAATMAKLAARGVDRLDLVVFSHGHHDHVNGLVEVSKRIPIGLTLHPGVAGPAVSALGPAAHLKSAAVGDRFAVGELDVEVLGPSPASRQLASDAAQSGNGEGVYLNDASLVVRIGWRSGCALFVGDIQEEGQERLVDEYPDRIHCAILKAPHHGSSHLSQLFINAVGAESVSVSVGHNNYGLPSASALKMFESSGASVMRTDRLGDTVVELDDSGHARGRDADSPTVRPG